MLITSSANPKIKRALKLRKSRQRRTDHALLAEGVREVIRAAQAGLTIDQVFICPAMLGSNAEQSVREAVGAGGTSASASTWHDSTPPSPPSADKPPPANQPEFFEVEPELLTTMTYRRDPEGVLAVVTQPHWTLQRLGPTTERTLILVTVGTEKPGNLGAMVRTADAAGAQAVLSPDLRVDPFNPNAIRASTGAVFSMPIVQAQAQAVIRWLEAVGIRLVAASPQATLDYTQADLTGPLALVIGPEDVGLDELWLDAASNSQTPTPEAQPPSGAQSRFNTKSRPGSAVRIPTCGQTADSLNASNAAAVLLFEARRQRGQR